MATVQPLVRLPPVLVGSVKALGYIGIGGVLLRQRRDAAFHYNF
jgi:hypothetical protein